MELCFKSNLAMKFENKVLLTLLFVIQYKGNKHLAYQFGISYYYVSKVLDEIFPILVEYFSSHIPNKSIVSTHSRLHHQIKYIIDNTIHKCRRPSVNHDALSATYNNLFRRITGTSSFALGDTGFSGINYVVPGIKTAHIKTIPQLIFNQISRGEQRRIEHINKFFKSCRSVNREDTFYHSEDRLLACIFISIGLYNYKKARGYYFNL